MANSRNTKRNFKCLRLVNVYFLQSQQHRIFGIVVGGNISCSGAGCIRLNQCVGQTYILSRFYFKRTKAKAVVAIVYIRKVSDSDRHRDFLRVSESDNQRIDLIKAILSLPAIKVFKRYFRIEQILSNVIFLVFQHNFSRKQRVVGVVVDGLHSLTVFGGIDCQTRCHFINDTVSKGGIPTME